LKFEWDICYTNISGSKTYLYSEEKIELERKTKTKIVNNFIKEYKNIMLKLENDLKKSNDIKYLALYFLLTTYIRVGNIEYYKIYKHKGLTTLQKNNIKINNLNNEIQFKFIGKDGIPQNIIKQFPEFIIKKLKNKLKKLNDDDFVFTNKKLQPIHSDIFSKILFKYTNKHFYPHIIRSYHADIECKNFLKNHKKPQTKIKIISKFEKIANDLGHKKFDKNKNKYVPDYKMTIDSYIRPEYVNKMKQLYEKSNI